MKKTINKFLFLVLTVLMLLPISCSNNDEYAMNEGLRLSTINDIKWSLIAGGDVWENGSMKTNLITEETPSYVIEFKRDSTFVGRTPKNTFSGKTSRGRSNLSLQINDIEKLKLMETQEGKAYLDMLSKVQYYEVIYKNEEKILHLSYPKDKRYCLEYKALSGK